MFPLIDLRLVFGVAGLVTYLEKEKGAPAGCGAGAETEDDEEGATPDWNLRAIDSCGLRWLQCENAAVARPAVAGRLSGMKIKPQKCVIYYA